MHRFLATILIVGWVILSGFDLVEDLDEVPGQIAISTASSHDGTPPKLGGWGTFANNMVESADLVKQTDTVPAHYRSIPCPSNILLEVPKPSALHKMHHVFLI